ncbi:N-acetylmuramoyl-L-alanine amidase [Paenibacillus sp. J2TS4]|uniref:N-acetylmuramoyl-L-alanine amidase family protein n=1 Tax=Paenibacillus sp. J2TS4 TaxID=2807194 RepID=UPI001B0B3CFF|nr:N-acetylmuramoyl-L-alanine amidase [Paenibacillus sp. J2TS4]GIP31336.1 amidase [Paenibacillus sp. J2TS4]
MLVYLLPLLSLLQSFALLGCAEETQVAPFPVYSLLMPEAEILIDVGHGGIDGGTSHGSLLEKDINLQMGYQLYSALRDKKYNVAINRIGDYALSDDNRFPKMRSRHRRDLIQRKEIANRLKPKIMVSLHVNWSRRSSQSGGIVLHQKNAESKNLAVHIQQSLNKLYRTSHSVFHGKTYFLLNQTKCPTVIVEMGFISNPSDRKRLTDPVLQQELADTIADGIDKYLNKIPLEVK